MPVVLAAAGVAGLLGCLQTTPWSRSTVDSGIAMGLMANAPATSQRGLHRLMQRYTQVSAVWTPAVNPWWQICACETETEHGATDAWNGVVRTPCWVAMPGGLFARRVIGAECGTPSALVTAGDDGHGER